MTAIVEKITQNLIAALKEITASTWAKHGATAWSGALFTWESASTAYENDVGSRVFRFTAPAALGRGKMPFIVVPEPVERSEGIGGQPDRWDNFVAYEIEGYVAGTLFPVGAEKHLGTIVQSLLADMKRAVMKDRHLGVHDDGKPAAINTIIQGCEVYVGGDEAPIGLGILRIEARYRHSEKDPAAHPGG